MIGTSAVLSKHGTPDMPHTFLQVAREERYSPGPDVRTEHVTLRFGVCTDGPSELGALILHPDARGAPDKPGKLLSWHSSTLTGAAATAGAPTTASASTNRPSFMGSSFICPTCIDGDVALPRVQVILC